MDPDERRWALAAAASSGVMAAAGYRNLGLALAPNLAWGAFFLAWALRPRLLRAAAAVSLAVAIPARGLLWIAFLTSTLDLNGVGWLFALAKGLAIAGWALLLVAVAANLRLAPIQTVAGWLAIVVAVASLNEILLASARLLSIGGTSAVFWRNAPLGTLWRLVCEPSVQLLYVASQVFFLRAVGRGPEQRTVWGSL